MRRNSADLDEANDILRILKNEQINSSSEFNMVINSIRKITEVVIASKGEMLAPSLTACVALTYLKLGLCQELGQRFLLEYCLKYKKKDLNFIFLFNPNDLNINHLLIQFGSVNATDDLFVGRDKKQTALSNKSIKLIDFLENNAKSLFVDPLLNLTISTNVEMVILKNYCNQQGLTEVRGVRSFLSTPQLVENAAAIQKQAQNVAQEVFKQTATGVTSLFCNATLFSHSTRIVENEKGSAFDEDGEPTVRFSFYKPQK